jgi:hypothetical protein
LLHSPTYYQPRFTADELATLDQHTRAVALRLGCRAALEAGPVSAPA